MKRTSRAPSELSKSLHQRLNMYALAASAAGVGALAVTQTTEAKIIYTPKHVVIKPGGSFPIEFTHNGVAEVTILNTHFMGNFNGSVNSVLAFPSFAGAAIEGTGRGYYFFYGLALKKGTPIQYGQPFAELKAMMVAQCANGTHSSRPPCSSRPSNTVGNWINVKDRYLGLEFTIHGKVHYGWARLTVQVSKAQHTATATLTGYAYETIPNKPIIAGKTKGPDVVTVEPGSLGALAAGASKLAH